MDTGGITIAYNISEIACVYERQGCILTLSCLKCPEPPIFSFLSTSERNFHEIFKENEKVNLLQISLQSMPIHKLLVKNNRDRQPLSKHLKG